eukprot:TRINITY_DN44850_c0_g1_i1.p1 TRINITY_DN44850_c0_g1~~TRINITY_DN44850_c0_g1_i1.p1  ORF type:complete len:448 (-),score=82.33 TRINITY_DN44850_c0_g1_i1:589-1932(-)
MNMSAEHGDGFDVESFIDAFLADTTSTSVELPSLTAAQRKHVKKAADYHPELQCESFGFGQERKMHFFKKTVAEPVKVHSPDTVREKKHTTDDARALISVDSAHGQGVLGEQACGESQMTANNLFSVKNTFIDDWVAMEANSASESVIFRSMPPVLRKNSSVGSAAVGNEDCGLASASEDVESCELQKEPLEQRFSSPDRSTVASSSSPQSVDRDALPQVPLPLGLPPPPGLEVRNTFIHFDTASADQRIVQSMPHGMFGRCLWEEAAADRVAAAALTPRTPPPPLVAWEQGLLSAPPRPAGTSALPPNVPPPELVTSEAEVSVNQDAPSWFAAGAEVEIVGLSKMPAFNGLKAIVQGWDDATGRYNVLLSASASSGERLAKIKGENLVSTCSLTPPPGYAAMLSADLVEDDLCVDCQRLGFDVPPTPTMWGDHPERAHALKLTALV